MLGLSAGIWAGFVAKRWFQGSPGSRRLPIRKLLAVLVRALVAGLATWTVTLLVAVIGREALLAAKGTLASQFVEVVLWLGFLTGLAAAPIVWIKGMERPAVLVSTSTPISVWQADRNLSLVRILAAGVMFGLVFFVFDFFGAFALRVDLQGRSQPGLGLADALVQGFASGVTGLLVGGLAGGLVGRHHAWLLYVLVVRTAPTIHLPAKLMPFLDDMHRLGLLRTVEPVYQFRHAELQDHLAPAPGPDGDPSRRQEPSRHDVSAFDRVARSHIGSGCHTEYGRFGPPSL